MAFLNLSFEIVGGSPGQAASWTLTSQSVQEIADFSGKSTETFELGWSSNDTYLYSFDDPADLTVLQVSTVGPAPFKTVENFEELFDSNEDYVFGGIAFGGTVATFDTAVPQNFEDFEQEWASNESYKFSFVGPGTDLTVMAFDTSPENFEDFEENWTSNESYKFSFVGPGTDLTLLTYTEGQTSENFETNSGTDPWPLMTTI